MKSILYSILMFTHITCLAQNKTNYRVTYKINYLHNLNKPDQRIRHNLYLYVSEEKTAFRHIPFYDLHKISNENINEPLKTTQTPTKFYEAKIIWPVYSHDIFTECILQNLKENIYYERVGLVYDYYYKEKLPFFNWKLIDTTKYILDYKVQMAIGEYAGREYIAWFSTELLYKSGPWKFNGLPGLILEITDTKNEIHFYAAEVTQENNTIPDIDTRFAVFVNKKELEKIKKRRDLDPYSFRESNFYFTFIDQSEKVYTGNEAEKLIKKNIEYINKELKYNTIENFK